MITANSFTVKALRQLVDVVRRSDPDYVKSHAGVKQCTDDEWDEALEYAEDVLDGLAQNVPVPSKESKL